MHMKEIINLLVDYMLHLCLSTVLRCRNVVKEIVEETGNSLPLFLTGQSLRSNIT